MGEETRYRAYTGVGSRRTPPEVQQRMRDIAVQLAGAGITLRSGAAEGADQAFERGCDQARGPKEIYIPWEMYGEESARGCEGICIIGEERDGSPGVHTPEVRERVRHARDIARSIHPAWWACSSNAHLLHTRNVFQVLGTELDTPSLFVICWTLDGLAKGGTRTAIVLAQEHGVPVFNLGSADWTLRQIVEHVLERKRRCS